MIRRRLSLRSETVRVLGAIDLRRAIGAMAYQRSDVADLCQSDEAGGCGTTAPTGCIWTHNFACWPAP